MLQPRSVKVSTEPLEELPSELDQLHALEIESLVQVDFQEEQPLREHK